MIVGTFQGGITFVGAEVAPDVRNGFVARYEPDGTPRYEQVVTADLFEAGVRAVAVTGGDVTWIATGCTGGFQVFRAVGGAVVSSIECDYPRRLDRPLDPDGVPHPVGSLSWQADLPLEELVAIGAQADSVGTFLHQFGNVLPWIGRWYDQEQPASCQIEAAIVPAAVQLEDTGQMWIAGSFEGALDSLGIASAGVGRDVFVGLMHDFSNCRNADFESAGGAADEEVLDLAVSTGGWVVTGRSDDDGFVRDADGDVGALRSDDAGVITEIVEKEVGWIVAGTSGANATYDAGVSTGLPSLGARDARVLGLGGDLAYRWQVTLGGLGDDDAAGVRIDEARGELVVLGTTTGPSGLDPEGILADGERAIFVHRFAPP